MKRLLSCDRSFSTLFAFSVVAIASPLAFDRAAAQAPAWQIEMAKADADYDDAMEKLGERRRTAVQKAGETWIKSITAEVVEATRAGDNTLARGLQAKLAAAREAGRVPLARPPVVTFDRHDYALIEDPKTWMEAKEHCERMGGHLLILDDAKEEAFILSNLGKIGFWIGATDLWTPGRTLSLDGKPFRGFAAKAQFDNHRNRENGVAWAVGAKCWNDLSDGQRIAYVCEWE
jgi:hypothetical protein